MDTVALINRLAPDTHASIEAVAFAQEYIPQVLEQLSCQGVQFNENSILAFISHMICVIDRMEKSEKVKDLGENVLSQLDETARDIATDIVLPLQKRYQTTLDHSELALITIHIQAAMMKL